MVSADLLMKAASSRDPAVVKLGADTVELQAKDLSGRAFHHRKRHLDKVEAALRNVFHGGCPLPAALEQAGLAPVAAPAALGTSPGDKAAVPRARR